MRIHILCACLCFTALFGCTSSNTLPTPPTGSGGMIHECNEGYSLLYKLMADESDVGKIFFLKSASDPVKSLVKEIGAAAQEAKKQMDTFPTAANQIEFNVADLPYMEQRGRDLQAKEDEHDLLFSSGKEFELRLVFTQAQAMDYAKQLCNALAEKETDPTRKAFLNSLAKQCNDFHDRLMKLLTVQA
jgi:hypothetical protein